MSDFGGGDRGSAMHVQSQFGRSGREEARRRFGGQEDVDEITGQPTETAGAELTGRAAGLAEAQRRFGKPSPLDDEDED